MDQQPSDYPVTSRQSGDLTTSTVQERDQLFRRIQFIDADATIDRITQPQPQAGMIVPPARVPQIVVVNLDGKDIVLQCPRPPFCRRSPAT